MGKPLVEYADGRRDLVNVARITHLADEAKAMIDHDGSVQVISLASILDLGKTPRCYRQSNRSLCLRHWGEGRSIASRGNRDS
jgi:hypothetical protein